MTKIKIYKNIFELIWVIKEYFMYWIRPFKLDIHLTEHCNLNCVSCLHYSPLAKPEYCNIKDLEASFRNLRKFQKYFTVLQLLGGEPLLNPNIIKIFQVCRKYFNKTKIKLVSNGILLDQMSEEFWEACRKYEIIVSITLYPIKLNYNKILDLCKRKEVEHEIYAIRDGESGFYANRVNPNGGIKTFMKFIKCQCSGCFQLIGNKIYACPINAYIRHLNIAFGYNFKQSPGDYVRIDKMKTAFQLRWLRARNKPFCFYCELRGNAFPWRQSEKKEEEWVKR